MSDEEVPVSPYRLPKYERKGSRLTKRSKRVESNESRNNGLSEKQVRFINEYVSCGDATKAATAAGYSETNAKRIGSQLLHHALVAAEVDKFHRRAAMKAQIKADDVIAELGKVAFDENFTPTKVRALELLGKHLQLFTERVELKVEAMSPEERAARAAALIATARNRLLSAGTGEPDEDGVIK